MLIILVFMYSKYISKHISKDNDIINARRFCVVLAVLVYTFIAILPPALPRALFLNVAPLLALLAVFLALCCDIQRTTDETRRVSLAVWRLVAFPSVSAFLSVLVGEYIHRPRPPKPDHEIWAAFPKIFFEILFFYFSSLSFAGFFRVE